MRGDGDVAAAVEAIVPGGADYAFEAIGLQRTIELMPDLICLGGTAVMVGMTPEDVRVSFSGFGMAEFGHSVLGSNYGSSVAPIDFPRIAALYEAGKLPIDRLITRRVALDEVNERVRRHARPARRARRDRLRLNRGRVPAPAGRARRASSCPRSAPGR